MEEEIQENQPNQPILEPTSVAIPAKKGRPLTVVILLIVILLIGVGGVYAGVMIGKKSQVKVWVEPPFTEITPEPTVISDETANWNKYIRASANFGSFSVEYPEDWLISENQTKRPKSEQVFITLSKADYKIAIDAFIDGWSPSGCNFDKTTKNILQTADYDSYIKLDNLSAELRRALPPIKDGNTITWVICAKESGSNLFATAFPFSGTITYITPTNFDETIIKEMDQILSTFKFTN